LFLKPNPNNAKIMDQAQDTSKGQDGISEIMREVMREETRAESMEIDRQILENENGFTFIKCGGPTSKLDPHGIFATPDAGWESIIENENCLELRDVRLNSERIQKANREAAESLNMRITEFIQASKTHEEGRAKNEGVE
jgi:hypothetical protein